jgi:hypothetical protein
MGNIKQEKTLESNYTKKVAWLPKTKKVVATPWNKNGVFDSVANPVRECKTITPTDSVTNPVMVCKTNAPSDLAVDVTVTKSNNSNKIV